MQMMQLSKLKKDRAEELSNLRSIKSDLDKQVSLKNKEIEELKKAIRLFEGEVSDIQVKLKKLESQQNSVKKVDEFNALTQEIATAERERSTKEQRLSDMYDKLAAEEDMLHGLKGTLESTAQSSTQLEQEIRDRSDAVEIGASVELIASGSRGLRRLRGMKVTRPTCSSLRCSSSCDATASSWSAFQRITCSAGPKLSGRKRPRLPKV